MQFSHRIGVIVVSVFLLCGIHFVIRSGNEGDEVDPETRILGMLATLETHITEYESIVQSYRAELMAAKDLLHLPLRPVQLTSVTSLFSTGNSTTITEKLEHETDTPGSTVSQINSAGLINSNRLKTSNIYYSLPHLMDFEDGLVPALKISKDRMGVSIVMGIPTVKRPTQSYLMTTLQSLLTGMKPKEKNDSLVIVFIAESDISFVQNTVHLISKKFQADIDTGLLEIVSPSPNFYPDLKSIKGTLGDSDERTRWRTKQNLDYAYMMLYAQHRGTYYVQLEDDVLAKKGFVRSMKSFALEKTVEKEDWFMLDFCQLGFIGKLFRSSDLWRLAEFFLLFYKDKPGDWLLSHFFSIKYCKLDQSHKKCLNELKKHWVHYKPSLFQHIGMISSLNGKVQKLKDRQYGKLELFTPHYNPPTAKIESTIQHYGKFSLTQAYEGKNYFWGLSPKAGDTIQFTYDPPIHISKYRLVSGNAEHPSDKLYNCTLQVMPAKLPKSSASLGGKIVELNEFDELGVLEGTIPDQMQPVQFLRLSLKSPSENWLILSEIHIQVDSDF